jgi:hypothetical protein
MPYAPQGVKGFDEQQRAMKSSEKSKLVRSSIYRKEAAFVIAQTV